jgi:redox-sensitive bicupin YhaK (pirin superfamily)
MAGRPDLKHLNAGTGIWHENLELEEDKEDNLLKYIKLALMFPRSFLSPSVQTLLG